MTPRKISKKKMERIHPYIPEAYDQLHDGRITRREFLHVVTLLGMSAGTAVLAAACGPAPPTNTTVPLPTATSTSTPTAEPTATHLPTATSTFQPTPTSTSTMTPQPTSTSTSTMTPQPTSTSTSSATEVTENTLTGEIKRGGIFVKAMGLGELVHPAALNWVEGGNVVRLVNEYLTEIGPDNITHPYLLERWQASDDLRTWDLFIRRGITFSNGDQLTSDDVIFTIGEWLNPDVGSSMLGLLGGRTNAEKVNDYHIRLHLDSPNLHIPEYLSHYPAVILHRAFQGNFVDQPIGTGAFLLKEYRSGDRAVFQRRDDYWRSDQAGNALPFLDEVRYVSIDRSTSVEMLSSGEIDSLYAPSLSEFRQLREVAGLNINRASSSSGLILRMRVDADPWTDNRVRTALKMCQDREMILQQANAGEGDLAIDAHVAPVHPEYCEKPIPKYDPVGAQALLEDYARDNDIQLPLKVTLVTKNDEHEPEVARVLKELALPGGFDITLDITGATGYWSRWMDVDLGITSWVHRPSAIQFLQLGYSEEALGYWNESRWTDAEFEKLLNQAEGTLDANERRGIMCKIEDIMQERGPIGVSYWRYTWNICRSRWQNVRAHPANVDMLYDVWKSE